jgi:glycosyltransferase involved in cell wall biosynthesis
LLLRTTIALMRTRSSLGYALRRAYSITRQAGLRGLLARLHALSSIDPDAYRRWIAAYDSISEEDTVAMRRIAGAFAERPLISILTPVYNTDQDLLCAAIESVRGQTYENWQLCIADDGSTLPHVRAVLQHYARLDARIKIVYRTENGHISRASNSALAVADGTWIVLLDHDDLLAPHALFCVVDAINRNPRAQLIYSDEDKIDLNGRRQSPYFKPDWNPYLFLSHNMISHLAAYRTELVRQIGGFRMGFEGSQDYDLALRYIEQVEDADVHHIPHVLYHWRVMPGSTALNNSEKPYAQIAAAKAIEDSLRRRNVSARVSIDRAGYSVHYALPTPPPLVSLIVVARREERYLRRCISSIRARTTYPSYEIVVAAPKRGAASMEAYLGGLAACDRISIIRAGQAASPAALHNAGVAAAKGTVIGLLDSDMEVIAPAWLAQMVGLALQPDVGAVGARLWSPDHRLRHAGLVLGLTGSAGYVYRGLPSGHHGHCGRASLVQAVSAVSGACLIVRKNLYLRLGGLDESHAAHDFYDVDFCLKLRELGYRSVWTPHAELCQHGVDDRTPDAAAVRKAGDVMLRRWGSELRTEDPAYSPNLTLEMENGSLAFPPRKEKPWRVSATSSVERLR